MEVKEIMECVDTLKKESSSLQKIELLKGFLKDEEFRIFVEMSLDETLHYNVKKLPNDVPRHTEPDFYMLVEYLHFLSSKQGANAKEKQELAAWVIDKDWEGLITKIISKDLKCGAGPKLINAASPGSITVFPYCGCSTSKKITNIHFPAYFQIKEDGLFANIFRSKDKISYFSRNGNEFVFPEDSLKQKIDKKFPVHHEKTMVYTGEFRILKDGKWLPRKTSNGIVNKALKKNQTQQEYESVSIHFICWDIIPEENFWEGTYDVGYNKRFKELDFLEPFAPGIIGESEGRLHLSYTRIINSVKEGQNFALDLINFGEEGGIIKNFDSKWQDTHSTTQIKLKAGDIGDGNEQECELRVVDWYYGKPGTKYEKCLGGLICESEDGLLNTRIGGGYSNLQRGFLGLDNDANPIILENIKEFIENTYLDEIITARFNEAIKAKTSKQWSLFSARFIEVRFDKKIADTLEYIRDL